MPGEREWRRGRLCTLVPTDKTRGNGHKLKNMNFHLLLCTLLEQWDFTWSKEILSKLNNSVILWLNSNEKSTNLSQSDTVHKSRHNKTCRMPHCQEIIIWLYRKPSIANDWKKSTVFLQKHYVALETKILCRIMSISHFELY